MTPFRSAAAAAALALIALTSVSACGGSSSSPSSSAAAPSSSAAPSPTAAQLPADWPKEAPVIPGFTLVSTGTSGDTLTAQFQAAGDQSKAVKDYAIWLQNNGWALDSQIPPGTNGMWGFRAYGYSLTMLATAFGDQTVVSVNLQPV